MIDRPIIFSAPMVRAILSRTKTQTRRLMAPQRDRINGDRAAWSSNPWVWAITLRRVEQAR